MIIHVTKLGGARLASCKLPMQIFSGLITQSFCGGGRLRDEHKIRTRLASCMNTCYMYTLDFVNQRKRADMDNCSFFVIPLYTYKGDICVCRVC